VYLIHLILIIIHFLYPLLHIRLITFILSTNPWMCGLVCGSRHYSVVLCSNYCNLADDCSTSTVICRTHRALTREFIHDLWFKYWYVNKMKSIVPLYGKL
jgi:hypothetical protein